MLQLFHLQLFINIISLEVQLYVWHCLAFEVQIVPNGIISLSMKCTRRVIWTLISLLTKTAQFSVNWTTIGAYICASLWKKRAIELRLFVILSTFAKVHVYFMCVCYNKKALASCLTWYICSWWVFVVCGLSENVKIFTVIDN